MVQDEQGGLNPINEFLPLHAQSVGWRTLSGSCQTRHSSTTSGMGQCV